MHGNRKRTEHDTASLMPTLPDIPSEYIRSTIVSMKTKHNTRLTVNPSSYSKGGQTTPYD